MSAQELFLAVDGGGSKTTAVVFDGEGKCLTSTVGESINYCSLGIERARHNMAEIIDAIALKTGVRRFCSAFIGMSALSGKAQEHELAAFANGIVESRFLSMDSDLYIAMQSLLSDGACAVVISGTGSMVIARDANGEIVHAGGWGHLLGDEGSGFCLATRGLKAGIRAFEGSGALTFLTDEILSFFNINEVSDIIDIFYNPPLGRKEIAAFAEAVIRQADGGDRVALEIVKDEAASLAATAETLLCKLPRNIHVGLWGGIFQHCISFRTEFSEILRSNGNEGAALLEYPPEIGALFAAYKAAGISVTPGMLSKITETYLS